MPGLLQKTTLIAEEEHVYGDIERASVVVIEYADTECPYCKAFHAKFRKEVIESHGAQVAWVYRHRLLPIYPRSAKEAEALECAAGQKGNEAFWPYLDRLFAITPSGNKLDPAELPKIAAHLELDVVRFENCLAEGIFAQKVREQSEESIRAGVTLTPSVHVWNKATGEKTFISGANSRFAEVKALVENILESP